MDFAADPEPKNLRELRVLVLHNRDFEGDSSQSASNSQDMELVSRADVENAAQNIAHALAARGHFVEIKGIDRDDIGELCARLRQDPPDLVYNLCESLAGDARHELVMPVLLDMLEIAYTGSGPLCLGTCLHKYKTKQILRAAAIPTPPAALLPALPRAPIEDLLASAGVGYPLFLKLAQMDASIGISAASIVHNEEEFVRQVEHLRSRYKQPILVERFIEGRELYVSMLQNAPPALLPLQEIDFGQLSAEQPRIVSEDSKWNSAAPEYHQLVSTAAKALPASVAERVLAVASETFSVLEVRDYGRCDIRLSADGTPYVIDVNPNCDLSNGAGFSRAGLLAGISYDRLVEKIAIAALQRNDHARRTIDFQNRPNDESDDRPISVLSEK